MRAHAHTHTHMRTHMHTYTHTYTHIHTRTKTYTTHAHTHTYTHIHTQVTKTLNERISRFAQLSLESCAYAGTGNVLKVQELLATCGEHIEAEGEGDAWKVRMCVLLRT